MALVAGKKGWADTGLTATIEGRDGFVRLL